MNGANLLAFVVALVPALLASAQENNLNVRRDVPYSQSVDHLRTLDVYAPAGAKGLPVVVWIHGGGWEAGDKADMKAKPQAFADKAFVFVSVNYRFWPKVTMGEIVRDVAQSIHWVHDHVAESGGDPQRLFIMGHSAGAQLAALLCTDERFFQAENLSFDIVKGCVPVDGDTYDVPAIIAIEDTRNRVYGLPELKNGHRPKFGTPEQQKDFSAVSHVAQGKGIPPFLILYVANHPDTSAQAKHLAGVLKSAGVPVTAFGARDTDHSKLNDNLGLPGDAPTKELFAFLDSVLKR